MLDLTVCILICAHIFPHTKLNQGQSGKLTVLWLISEKCNHTVDEPKTVNSSDYRNMSETFGDVTVK